MGWFSLINGNFKPSDNYLKSHNLEDYEQDDVENEDYDVEEDDDAMNMTRTCDKCGKSFTLADAIMEYDSFADGTSYMENYAGEICGECAIDELEDAWREADQYQ